jgi:diguanylate cyclase (GGDEF)-like protein
MPAAVRGRGLLVAFGFPSAALVALAFWLHFHGSPVTIGWPAAVALVFLTALAAQIEMVVSPRASACAAGPLVAAAALLGGPLVGALVGASVEALSSGSVWPKRATWAGAAALQGFAVGAIGLRPVTTPAGALAVAGVGLVVGFAANQSLGALVMFDRGIRLRPEFSRAWRAIVVEWFAPWLPLAAFLYLFRSSSTLALGLAAGLVLILWLANRLRLRLEQALAEERLRSRHDALTGAPNRYALNEALTNEFARIKRGDRPAALCFLDLDLFREVNNGYDYATGDELLVSVYRRLRDHLRASDQIFRWGGEEFVVLAPRIDHLELADFAERLRLLVADQGFTLSRAEIRITCSVGAALLDESRLPDAALETASRLVHAAKRRRNAVEVDAAHSDRCGVPAIPATE